MIIKKKPPGPKPCCVDKTNDNDELHQSIEGKFKWPL